MKKILPPFALAILVTIAGTNPGLAMENSCEQKQCFQTALLKLEEFGKYQKKETALVEEITKKKLKLETLGDTTQQKLREVLSLTPEQAKVEAYKLAAKMDKRSEETHKNNQESANKRQQEESQRSEKQGITAKTTEQIKNNESTYKPHWSEVLRTLENDLQAHEKKCELERNKFFGQPCPSLILSFCNTPFIGIGHHLFFRAMENKFQHTKMGTSTYLKSTEFLVKMNGEWTQRSKKDFIQSYSSLNEENVRKIKEIAEMQGIKLFDAAK